MKINSLYRSNNYSRQVPQSSKSSHKISFGADDKQYRFFHITQQELDWFKDVKNAIFRGEESKLLDFAQTATNLAKSSMGKNGSINNEELQKFLLFVEMEQKPATDDIANSCEFLSALVETMEDLILDNGKLLKETENQLRENINKLNEKQKTNMTLGLIGLAKNVKIRFENNSALAGFLDYVNSILANDLSH